MNNNYVNDLHKIMYELLACETNNFLEFIS